MVLIFFVFPVIWLIINSFKPESELYSIPATFTIHQPTLDNYTTAFSRGNFAVYFKNSTLITVITVFNMILINTASGFALAKYRFFVGRMLTVYFLALVMVPMEVMMLNVFIIIKNLGLYNSLWGIIIPLSASPVGQFIMRQYFLSLPNELLDAARIDGASEFFILKNIVFPIGKPAITVLAIFGFMWRWNEFIFPLIVISTPAKYTVQLAIAIFITNPTIKWGPIIAMSIITIIPIVVIFCFFQKQFLGGLTVGSIKE